MICTICGDDNAPKCRRVEDSPKCSKCYMKAYNASDKARKARSNYEKTEAGKKCRKAIDQKYYNGNLDKRLAKAARQTSSGYHNERYKENKAYYHEKSVRRTRQMDKSSLGGIHKKETIEVYATCPIGYEVDHIVPLHGKNVCSLHVPWNLQHLPRAENRKKSNKLVGENHEILQ